jgi:hypothetical protein
MTITADAVALMAEGRRALLVAGAEPTDANLSRWLATVAIRFRGDVSKGHVRAGLPPVGEATLDLGSPTDIHEAKR